MSFISAIIQGIVQGLTEFLPISSSGHLSVIRYFMGSGIEDGTVFTVLLHMGTLVAVFIAFRKTIINLIFELFSMIGDIFKGKFSYKKARPRRRMLIMLIIAQFPLLVALPLKDTIAGFGSDSDILIEGICFLITACILFWATSLSAGKKTQGEITAGDAACVGAFQAIALMPGISRSGSTICAGMLIGFSRETAIEFSFIMGIPAVLAANLMELKDAVALGNNMNPVIMIVGIICALVFGLLAIKMVSWLCKTDKFKYFAYYLLAIGSVCSTVGIISLFTK